VCGKTHENPMSSSICETCGRAESIANRIAQLKEREERLAAAAERRARFEAKMQELLGEELFDELTDWVKELIEEARRG
jgi:hypothetical protein